MRLSLSAISTVNASFAEDVVAYAAAGFDAIGLWEMKLPDDDAANVALLRSHGLAVSNCIPTVPSFLPLAIPGMEGPPDPGARIDAICASIRRLAAYEPECVLVLSGPLGEPAPRTTAGASSSTDCGGRRDRTRGGRPARASSRSIPPRAIPPGS